IEMRDVVKKLGKKHTVILSSHILQEVSAVCDRVMIINRGKIVASDTPEQLSANLNRGNNRMQVRVKGEKQKILKALTEFPIIRNVDISPSKEPGTIDLILSGEKDDMDVREIIFKCMAKNNLPILLMKSTELTLEEIFLTLTGDTRSGPSGHGQSSIVISGNDALAGEDAVEDIKEDIKEDAKEEVSQDEDNEPEEPAAANDESTDPTGGDN
ncbi:MAG: hypothetical protein FWE42_02450, partial [Defluviitaleaceae bacterium]|nr:hypothetical protein [Defluviitaleaceae bacterium]